MQTEQVKTNGTHAVRPELAMLNVADVDAHPNNPRKTFTAIEELAASITAHGLIEPIVVRPHGKGRYQLVCGERRWRASKAAKASTILSIVRVLDDKACEILMVEENTKRSDLHPLEEAEGYERLRSVHGMSVEEIAAKVSKTPATIYARMKLCALCKPARDACYKGKITASVALLLARIPSEKLQLEALNELKEEGESVANDEDWGPTAIAPSSEPAFAPVSERRAFRIIRDRFMLRLVDAPFDITDAKLVAKAGACTTCQHRTGNQAELFADVKSADVCTLPTCFRDKRDAEWDRRVANAKELGVSVMPASEAKKAFYESDTRLTYGVDYVDLDVEGYIDGKNTTYRKKLGKDLPPITIARDGDGGIHELVKRSTVETRGRNDAKPLTPAAKKRRDAERAERKKSDAKVAVEAKCTELAIATLVEKSEKKVPTADFYRALVVAWCTHNISSLVEDIFIARELSKETEEVDGKAVHRIVSKLSENTCRGLLIELVCVNNTVNVYGTRNEPSSERDAFDMLCDFYKVEPKKFLAEAKASVGAGAK